MTQKLCVTVTLKGQILQQYSFPARSVVIGRQRESDVVLDNAGVSRVHAEISFEDGCYYLNDCGSSNGSVLNGSKVVREQLHDGDIVSIGKFQLHVSIPSGDDKDKGIDLHGREITIRAPSSTDDAEARR